MRKGQKDNIPNPKSHFESIASRIPWLENLITEDEDRLSSYLVQGSVGALIVRVLSIGLSFIISIILARLLGVEGYGIYAYVFAWVLLLAMLSVMGLDKLLVRDVSKYNTKMEWGKMIGIIHRSNQAVLIISCVIALFAALTGWLISSPNNSTTLHAFWIALFLLPIISLTKIQQSILQGLQNIVTGLVPETFIQPILFIFFIVGIYFILNGTLSVHGAIASFVFAYAVTLAVLVFFLKKTLPKDTQNTVPIYETHFWIRSAYPLLLLDSMAAINARTDIIMIGVFKGTEMAGVYNIASRSSELVTFVLISVNMVLAPAIASLYATGEIRRLQHFITSTARAVLLLSLPIALFLIFAGKFFLSFFGQEFIRGYTGLCILTSGQLISVAMGSVGLLLVMTGHERKAAIGVGASAGLNIFLNAILIPRWGIEGASTATAISIILWNILLARWVYRELGIHTTVWGRISFGK
jgi:O-antigen/teichoic acid export membrane protein